MQKSKKYFFIATTAALLSSPFASAAPVVEITAALSQPTLVAGSIQANGFDEPAPALDHASAKPATTPAKAERADKPATPLSSWWMLIGAGVLLLPRKRRVDNVVR